MTDKTFDNKIYLRFEGDDDFASFCELDDAEAMEDGERIAIYELKEVRRVKVTKKLVKVSK